MGSSFYPTNAYQASIAVTGPTGPTGSKGNTGPTGYGIAGNTGTSVSTLGICGGKLRTYFNTGVTYETSSPIKGYTGNTSFVAGISSGKGLSFYAEFSQENNSLNFRTLKGGTSSSGRATITVGLTSSDMIYVDYINRSSGLTIGITGNPSIGTFVGYSGNTLVSIEKTIQGTYSSFLSKNVIEKARGLGFSGATSAENILCNYITGGTFFYRDSLTGLSAATGCRVVNINPNCLSNNSVDLNVKNNVYIADMKKKTTIVILGNTGGYDYASAITLVLMNASNGPTAAGLGQKRFQLSNTGGSLLWPFNTEPCFCGPTGTDVYHFYNLGGYTWYGSIASMTDPSLFTKCVSTQIQGINVPLGSCCINDGSSGGTCSYVSLFDCLGRGLSAFWHEGVTCGSNPCTKTGGCCMAFTPKGAASSSICLNGITCINCISGRVYSPQGATYLARSFTYLGNGITCTSTNCSGTNAAVIGE